MKRNLIRYLLPVAVITALAVILIFINAYSLGKREADAEVEQLYGIVGIIREKYPNVSEEEIVHSLKEWGRGTEELTDDEVRRLGKNILDKYGYEGGFLSNAQKKNLKTAGLFGALIVIFTGAMIGLYDMVVGAKRRKDIEELTTYLNKLTNRIYDLQLKENSEDELSLLRNEIYKTTVSLRETSELSKKENAALTRSLEDISHQLKTPLASLRLFVEMDESAHMAEELGQIERMEKLIGSLLRLEKLCVDGYEFTFTEQAVRPLIENAWESLRALWPKKHMEIEGDAALRCDGKWLGEAFQNLLKNACEHTAEDGQIWAIIEQTEHTFYCSVEDNGGGVREKDLPHLFERFYRSEDQSQSGSGLGLAIVKEIVYRHHGHVSAENGQNGLRINLEIPILNLTKT